MSTPKFHLSGNIIDVVSGTVFRGTVVVEHGKITAITEGEVAGDNYILPGLIDSHIHIESSMLVPSEFARLASVHGTVATVSDPHEIANVMGLEGILFMIENGKKVPLKFYFGASSCVPATGFETSGARLDAEAMDELLQMDEILYMSEMMNFPGVLHNDPEVMAKLAVAKKHRKPVDGHAPGVMGEDARRYIAAGISTDHECYTLEEALEKIKYGMHVLIREGSAAKNFDVLIPLLKTHPDKVMLCSDDRHPNDLEKEHVDSFVRRALKRGYEPMRVFRAATLNPVRHYKLDVGLLQPGDPADLIVVDNLEHFTIMETYINGCLVSENGKTTIESVPVEPINNFNAGTIHEEDIRIDARGKHVQVIEAFDGELITANLKKDAGIVEVGEVSKPGTDVLKMVVVNRYEDAKPAIAFVKNFGLKHGAIASSVAHDSHNVIAVGVTDKEITEAINMVMEAKGGVSLVDGEIRNMLPLPVAGLMSNDDGYAVARQYDALDKQAKALGSTLGAPYMTLSFMALLVIPALKLSDKGLFDGEKFAFTPLFSE